MDNERIQRQAKQILDNFADALASVEKEGKEEADVERDEFERKEVRMETKVSLTSHPSLDSDTEFRQALLKNAPTHDDDFIIAEKGDWK